MGQWTAAISAVEATSTAFMGLTMGCARCHTHKYDPISHKEFYQFFAFFNNVPERGLDVLMAGTIVAWLLYATVLYLRVRVGRRATAARLALVGLAAVLVLQLGLLATHVA